MLQKNNYTAKRKRLIMISNNKYDITISIALLKKRGQDTTMSTLAKNQNQTAM